MSTNPFRRSSLKGPGGNNSSIGSSAPAPAPVESDVDGRSSPLTINTKASLPNQKHVNFASPPAIPISPVSYPPSSPESLRISPAFTAAQPVTLAATDYSGALQSDPFHAEAETDEDDGVIQQALQNAKANIDRVARDPRQEKEEAVRRTLSKFASVPRKIPVQQNNARSAAEANRQTMDVDAFTRMLMTGDSKQDDSTPASDTVSTSTLHTTSHESSSSDESLPLPQDTAYEQGQSANEIGSGKTDVTAPDATILGQNKRKPPPPKSRHGKAIPSKQPAITPETDQRPSSIRTLSDSSSGIVPADTTPPDPPKRAPPPPLSRRKSQNQHNTARTVQPKHTASQEKVVTTGPTANAGISKAPPPPPTRRPISMLVRHTSSDLPVTVEESDMSDQSTPSSRRPSDTRSFTTSVKPQANAKRASVGTFNTPPVPPPRRGRGSSRSSIDSQRPGLTLLSGNVGSPRSSAEYIRTEPDDTNAMSASNATDILADLAALQQEVDAARRTTSK